MKIAFGWVWDSEREANRPCLMFSQENYYVALDTREFSVAAIQDGLGTIQKSLWRKIEHSKPTTLAAHRLASESGP